MELFIILQVLFFSSSSFIFIGKGKYITLVKGWDIVVPII